MSASVSYDAMVEQLVGYGFPREKAEARAREEHPDVAARLDVDAVRNANILEKREQQVIMDLARTVGIRVWNTSQVRASKTTPGIADLRLTCRAKKFAADWETKRQVDGERSADQIEYGDDLVAAGVPYGYGDRYHFAEFLQAHGFTPPPIPRD